jgi:hypothetical protein
MPLERRFLFPRTSGEPLNRPIIGTPTQRYTRFIYRYSH